MSFDKILLQRKEYIKELVPNSLHLSSICKELDYCDNTRNTTKLRNFLILNKIDISHFLSYAPRTKVYENRVCPICDKIFSININNSKETKKVTCSIGCSNSYFRTGKNAGNYVHGNSNYRAVCIEYCNKYNIEFSCIICGFKDLVDVHHADEDRENSSTSNLIPMCPNHHKLWHRDYPDYIMEKIIEYQDRVDSSLA